MKYINLPLTTTTYNTKLIFEESEQDSKNKIGIVNDADVNAAIIIAHRSKHPVSQGFLLDGQVALVNQPSACKSSNNFSKYCKLPASAGGI